MVYYGRTAFETLGAETVSMMRTSHQTVQDDFSRWSPEQKQLGRFMEQEISQIKQLKLSPDLQRSPGTSTASVPLLLDAGKSIRSRRSAAAELRPLYTRTSDQPVPATPQNFSLPIRRHLEPTTDPLESPTVVTPVIDDPAWKKHDPPRELLYTVPDINLPFEIESILEASIETVQNRIVEELSQQEAERVARERQSKAESSGRVSTDEALSNFANFWKADEAGKLTANSTETGLLGPTIERERQPYSLQPPINAYSPTGGDWHPGSAKHLSTASSSKDSGYISGPVESESPKSKGFIFRKLFKRTTKGKGKGKATAVNGSDSGSVGDTKECVSCLDDFETIEVITLSCHSYCLGCFHELISNAVSSETFWPPKCCLNEIPSSSILPHIKPQLKKRYEKVVEERSIPANERVYCSKTSCGVFIPLRNINKLTCCAACPKCRTKTCTTCYGNYHNTSECPNDSALQATLKLAAESGWRRCIGCQAVVEHNEGCLHMTCKCKAQFCYICGSRWRTCSCTDADLAAYLQSAASRLAQAAMETAQTERERITRERAEREIERARQAEQDELREILQEIEEYETQEAIRLAMEEEASRLRAMAAREEREEKRVKEISRHFYELKNELESLHDMQRLALSERWRYEDEALKKQGKTSARERNVELKKLRVEQEANRPSQDMIDLRARQAVECQVVEWSTQDRMQTSQKAIADLVRDRAAQLSTLQTKWILQLREEEDAKTRGAEEEEALLAVLKRKFEESDETQNWSSNMSRMVWAHETLKRECHANLTSIQERHHEEALALEKAKLDQEIREANEKDELVMITKIEGMQKDRASDERWLKEVANERTTMLRAMELEMVVVDQEN